MSRIALTEQQWAFIRPLLPPPARTGRLRANDRRTCEGNSHLLVTGSRWQGLARAYATPTMGWRRLIRSARLPAGERQSGGDRKSTRLNSSHPSFPTRRSSDLNGRSSGHSFRLQHVLAVSVPTTVGHAKATRTSWSPAAAGRA